MLANNIKLHSQLIQAVDGIAGFIPYLRYLKVSYLTLLCITPSPSPPVLPSKLPSDLAPV